MLRREMERYVAVQRTSGFIFDDQARVLESYVAFAIAAGDMFVRTQRVLDWSLRTTSAQRRRTLLLTVRRFALWLTAESARHEVPDADLLPRARRARQQPYIYSSAKIEALVHCAEETATRGCPVPGLYPTLFGLLAATGMRISEALALDMSDITADGILIRHAKRKGRRLLPLSVVDGRQVDVGQQRRDDAPLRGSRDRVADSAFDHHARFQECEDEP